MDYVTAVFLLVALVPIFILLYWMIRRDGGPALFPHTRVGLHGRRFRCLKFRTMVPNAHEVLEHLLRTDAAAAQEWAETQKLRNDPRLTRIGRVLRKTSLDELPQLVNVLRLQMSLVGPRPIVESEIERYGDHIRYYHSVRPGITGLWQVSGRNDTTYEQRVHLDVHYVRGWSIRRDLLILSKTVVVVLFKRNGH
jgi:undecaprenyl-phosphate galactose phosphotransferase